MEIEGKGVCGCKWKLLHLVYVICAYSLDSLCSKAVGLYDCSMHIYEPEVQNILYHGYLLYLQIIATTLPSLPHKCHMSFLNKPFILFSSNLLYKYTSLIICIHLYGMNMDTDTI